jgi:hypothetical protein
MGYPSLDEKTAYCVSYHVELDQEFYAFGQSYHLTSLIPKYYYWTEAIDLFALFHSNSLTLAFDFERNNFVACHCRLFVEIVVVYAC